MVPSKRGIANFVAGIGRQSSGLAASVLELDVFSRYLAGAVLVQSGRSRRLDVV